MRLSFYILLSYLPTISLINSLSLTKKTNHKNEILGEWKNGKRDGKGISISGLKEEEEKYQKIHHLSLNHHFISFFMLFFSYQEIQCMKENGKMIRWKGKENLFIGWLIISF